LYNEAILLKIKSDAASDLIRDEQIRRYITNYLTPLVTQCAAYNSNTKIALSTGTKSLGTAVDARRVAQLTSQKILILAANINSLSILNSPELDSLNQSIIRVRSLYASIQLNASITKLSNALLLQKQKVVNYRNKNIAIRTKLDAFKQLYESLASLSC
jgi:hypothetical protein